MGTGYVLHSGGLNLEVDEEHLQRLEKMAKVHNITVDVYIKWLNIADDFSLPLEECWMINKLAGEYEDVSLADGAELFKRYCINRSENELREFLDIWKVLRSAKRWAAFKTFLELCQIAKEHELHRAGFLKALRGAIKHDIPFEKYLLIEKEINGDFSITHILAGIGVLAVLAFLFSFGS